MTSPTQIALLETTLRNGRANFYYADTKKASIKKIFYTMPDGVLRYTRIDKRKKTEKRLFDLQISNITRHFNVPIGWTKKAPLKKASKPNGKAKDFPSMGTEIGLLEEGKNLVKSFDDWLKRMRIAYPHSVVSIEIDDSNEMEIIHHHNLTF